MIESLSFSASKKKDSFHPGLKNLFLFLILILVTSPTCSIIQIFTYSYIPNEKIGWALAALYCIALNKKFDSLGIISFLTGLVFIGIIAMRLTFYDLTPNATDLNLVFFFLFGLPIYRCLLKSDASAFPTALWLTFLVQLSIAMFQNLTMVSGKYDLAMLFHTRDIQAGYLFPETPFPFFYRVSGLFFESSQFSSFCLLVSCYFFYYGNKNKTAAVKWLIPLAVVLLNFSITSYIAIALLAMYSIFRAGTLGVLKAAVAAGILLLAAECYAHQILERFMSEFEFRILYVTTHYSSHSIHSQRLTSLLQGLYMLPERPLIGFGHYWQTSDQPVPWDFITTYFYGYGLIGGIFSVILLVVSFFSIGIPLSLLFLTILTTNGSFLMPVCLLLSSMTLGDRKPRFSSFKNREQGQTFLRSEGQFS